MKSKQQAIKEDITQRAKELWGIENQENLDPIIELLLDTFSYEFSKIEQDIKISDAKLLERISKILVQEIWSLPTPSHALLSAKPVNPFFEINRNSQFYFQKVLQGNQFTDLFFTPLFSDTLINGHIASIARNKTLHIFDERGRKLTEIDTKGEKKIEDYTLWIGIDIEDELLKKVNQLPLALILRNSNLENYLNLVKFFNVDGFELEHLTLKDRDIKTNEHYIEHIIRYYQNYLFTVNLSTIKTKYGVENLFEDYFFKEDLEGFNKELFWLKIQFPVAFINTELDKIDVSMNTFPIVNRKLQYNQHNLVRNGKIASLRTLNEYFLNIENIFDNNGITYNNTLTNDINNLKGSYSLYFGELEQFDERNAKAILEQVIQTVREEGSSFSSVGYDLLNTYLEDLNDKLNVIEHKVSLGYKSVSNNNNRQYILTIPHENSTHIECQFWTTDADAANNISQGKILGQYQTNDLVPQTIVLQTDTIGGKVKNDAKEKISNLRYGLLSKDRIVSVEDVKEFIRKSIGKSLHRLNVTSGVGISPNKKGGLIRITQVDVYLTNQILESGENKKRLSSSLQKELEEKSVHNLPYNVTIH